MKAGAYLGEGRVGVLEVDEPEEPGEGEVQLDVAFCGVCGSDLHMAEYGIFPEGAVVGHELSATVRACGRNAGRFARGDRVAVRPLLGCGVCGHCVSRRERFCPDFLGLGSFHGLAVRILRGGMAPRINVPEGMLHRVHDGIGLEHAALVEPLAVAWHSVRESGLSKGESVVVMGAGPIGIAVVLAARAAGAGTIVVTEHSSARGGRAAHFGADQVVIAGSEDVSSRVQAVTRGGADVVFDAVGLPGSLDEAVRLVRPGGRIDVVGACMQPDTVLPALWLSREPRIRFSFVYSEDEFAEVVTMIAERRLVADEMISRVEPLEAIGDVFRSLATEKRDIKVLIRPTS